MSELAKNDHVCIVCWKRLATHAGHCQACGADLVPLADERAVEEVRRKADARITRRYWLETFLILGVSGPVAALFSHVFMSLIAWLAATAVVGAAYAWLVPGSAIGTLAGRRRRVSREIGTDVQLRESPNFWWKYFLLPFFLPGMLLVWMPDNVMPEPPDPLDWPPERIAAWLGAEPQT